MRIEQDSANIRSGQDPRTDGGLYNNDLMRSKALKQKQADKSQGIAFELSSQGLTDTAYGFGDQLKSADDLMQDVGNIDSSIRKNMMTVMQSTMSEEDYGEFMKNGGKVSDMTPDEQVTSLDRLKATLANSGTVIKGYNDDLSEELLTEITGDVNLSKKIEEALQEQDLPVNEENVRGITGALEKGKEIGNINDETVKYMVKNELEPTVDNLYKAQFSSGHETGRQSRGYYSSGEGYYARKADTLEWEEIKPQAERLIESFGLEKDEGTMENARWLIEQGIPLTENSLAGLNSVKELTLPLTSDTMIKPMAIGIADGIRPGSASLLREQTLSSEAASLAEEIKELDDAAVDRVVSKGEDLTIKNLRQEADAEASPVMNPEGSGEASLADPYLSARRQLEETRLAMSYEANLKLLRQGISIDTMPLSKLVESLKEAERDYFEPLLLKGEETLKEKGEKAELLDPRIAEYKETVNAFQSLRTVPLETMSGIDPIDGEFTLRRINMDGSALRERYERAGNAYETLMTAPRRDMGDSIQKAFRNVDDILSDNGFELTEANRKAVRTLGYAGSEINPESIDRVRVAEQALDTVIEQMNPVMTLRMIRDGENPLDENIFALRDRLSEKEPAESTEKYSRFLVRLSKKGEISEDEKEAFIGIYRLFNQVEKSDGKLLGNVLNAGQDLTLRNILSAARSNRAAGMDHEINDAFGGLEKLISKGTSISDQIDRGIQRAAAAQAGADTYYENLGGAILDKLSGLDLSNINGDTTMEELYDKALSGFEKEDQRASYDEDMELLSKAAACEERVVQALSRNDIPGTPMNILAENALMNNRGAAFKSLMGKAGDSSDRTGRQAERLKEAVENIAEGFSSYEEAGEKYVELLNASDEFLNENADSYEDIVDLRELNLLHKQMGIIARQARDETYEVPVQIEGEWTSINLKLVREGNEGGTVTVTMDTEAYGKVAAKFGLRDNLIDGFITGDDKDGLKKLEDKADELSRELSSSVGAIKQLNFVDSKNLDLNGFDVDNPAGEEGTGRETSGRALYDIAKTFITVLSRK